MYSVFQSVEGSRPSKISISQSNRLVESFSHLPARLLHSLPWRDCNKGQDRQPSAGGQWSATMSHVAEQNPARHLRKKLSRTVREESMPRDGLSQPLALTFFHKDLRYQHKSHEAAFAHIDEYCALHAGRTQDLDGHR